MIILVSVKHQSLWGMKSFRDTFTRISVYQNTGPYFMQIQMGFHGNFNGVCVSVVIGYKF